MTGSAKPRIRIDTNGKLKGFTPASAQRFYDAATPSRQTAPWRRPFTSSRSETYLALPWLRASAHDLARNDPHSAKAIGTLAVDLVGTGILPKADTGNKRLNRKIDAVMADALKAIDADGVTPNFAGWQLLAARTFFEDGEAIVRRRIRPSRLGLSVPVQFSLSDGKAEVLRTTALKCLGFLLIKPRLGGVFSLGDELQLTP